MSELPRAAGMIRGERPARWLLFETNQGTDDHVLPTSTNTPWTAGSFSGNVSSAPRTLLGGHVVFRMADREVLQHSGKPTKLSRGAATLQSPPRRSDVASGHQRAALRLLAWASQVREFV